VNEREFETFYRAIAPRLRRYLARLCDESEDLVQETFFRYLRAGYTAEGEERTKILFTIATNLARNRWARQRESLALDDQVPAPSHDAIERLDLIAALQELGARDRSLLWLAYVEGYGHRDIARIAGLGSASVRVLLFRAKRKLMLLLERNR
jgi:RNA polymerase sigma-70 factor, ECF subfamily